MKDGKLEAPNRKNPELRVSRLPGSMPGADANAACHGWRGQMDPQNREILANPILWLFYWDPWFQANPAGVSQLTQFLQDLFKSTWMFGLAEYGINPAVLYGISAITSAAPATLKTSDIYEVIETQLAGNTGIPTPQTRNLELAYLIITPAGCQLVDNSGNPMVGVGGYHTWDFYGKLPVFTQPNAYFAAVPLRRTRDANNNPLSVQQVLDQITPIISHELAEMFTDRAGNGWKAPNGCEIGDICEFESEVRLGQWAVEKYYSNVGQTCVVAPFVAQPQRRVIVTPHPVPLGVPTAITIRAIDPRTSVEATGIPGVIHNFTEEGQGLRIPFITPASLTVTLFDSEQTIVPKGITHTVAPSGTLNGDSTFAPTTFGFR
ncbi:MAG TPA: hypothetical protein VHQ22_19510 [Terriglobales bacterium]|jgi:hypothetical protein|nr:hypothetical protein [Terriglobales bacterium]